jgi:hypothetical protein
MCRPLDFISFARLRFGFPFRHHRGHQRWVNRLFQSWWRQKFQARVLAGRHPRLQWHYHPGNRQWRWGGTSPSPWRHWYEEVSKHQRPSNLDWHPHMSPNYQHHYHSWHSHHPNPFQWHQEAATHCFEHARHRSDHCRHSFLRFHSFDRHRWSRWHEHHRHHHHHPSLSLRQSSLLRCILFRELRHPKRLPPPLRTFKTATKWVGTQYIQFGQPRRHWDNKSGKNTFDLRLKFITGGAMLAGLYYVFQ